MNMNKILAAGLIAAVASTASFAQCTNGGFYVGANAGVAFTKLKADVDSRGSVSKKKTKFLAELVLGYDWRINDVMLGVDLTAGTMFGKTKKDIDAANGEETLKNTWSIALMPRVGYLVMPQLELYVTGGVKAAHYKFTFSETSGTSTAKKVKFLPVVGGGVRYEITPNIFAKLEYNYEFRKGVKLSEGAQESDINSVKTQAHVVKLGVGFRF